QVLHQLGGPPVHPDREARRGGVRQVPRALRESEAVAAGLPGMLTRARALAFLAGLLIVGVASGSALAVSPGPGPTPKGSPPRVAVSLVSDIVTIHPGSTFWVGVRHRIAPGWHTYWVNPGDSGEPMSIEWSLPPGFTAGPIVWPAPERMPVPPFMSYGY